MTLNVFLDHHLRKLQILERMGRPHHLRHHPHCHLHHHAAHHLHCYRHFQPITFQDHVPAKVSLSSAKSFTLPSYYVLLFNIFVHITMIVIYLFCLRKQIPLKKIGYMWLFTFLNIDTLKMHKKN